jgi:hypothetical protein
MSPSVSTANQHKSSLKRSALPEQLPGATNFSEDGQHAHPKWFVETLKAHPQFWEPLREATSLNQQYGRKRLAGHWALAYLAFVVSRHVDVEPWWNTANSSIWRTAGFRERPSLRAVQRRFVELEVLEDDFLDVANALISHAVKRSGGRVGTDLHVDSTESETHARLKHICPADSPCQQSKARLVSATLTADEAREHRHQEAESPDDELLSFSAGDVDDVTFAEPVDPEADETLGRRVKKVKIGGCWYRCLDRDAGIRAYTRGGKTKRFWVGYYNGKAIDHYTGAPVAVLVHSASINESIAYPELYRRATEATGKAPRAVVADRGYSLSSIFEYNTRRGVGTVAKWRRKHASITDRSQEATERWDQHGIVRCRYCGGPTRQVRFNVSEDRSSPRLWVKCQEAAPGSLCESREQTINCSEEWRMLIPMWRTSEPYLALEDTSRSFERVHHLWRRRYRVGSDTHELRPKRRGRACQQLRANVALIAEWLHIMWREGWLSSARRNTSQPVTNQGRKAAESLAAKRSQLGLDKPYGKVAVKLGIGPLRPQPPG